MRLRALALLAVICLSTIFVVEALANEGRLLGQTRLSRRENDLDILPLNPCQNLRGIKLKAYRGSAEIEFLAVQYGNNTRDRLPVRHRLAQGAETAWIDLRGGVRCVKAIAVMGDTERSLDQTVIQFWGR